MTRIAVDPDIYRRNLGIPPGVELEEDVEALSSAAADWFDTHGDPWTHADVVGIVEIDGDRIRLASGATLESELIAKGFSSTHVESVAVVGVSAGARVDAEIDRLWKAECAAESMFLAAYATSVVESLRAREADRLARLHAESGARVLPYYSPGYEGWGLEDQAALAGCLSDSGPLRVLESGGLSPHRSALAALGITCLEDDRDLAGFWFHRASPSESGARGEATYAFPQAALAKWNRDRLRLTAAAGGRLRALFRFDGTTCGCMGLPIVLSLELVLEATGRGDYRVLESTCTPVKGDRGFELMCAYVENRAGFLKSLRESLPLQGMTLAEAVEWNPEVSPAGCICLPSNRDHKWRIVAQTVHYAISQLEYEL